MLLGLPDPLRQISGGHTLQESMPQLMHLPVRISSCIWQK